MVLPVLDGSESWQRPSASVLVEGPRLRWRDTEGIGCCVLASRTKMSSCLATCARASGAAPSAQRSKRDRQSSRILLDIACHVEVNKVNVGRSRRGGCAFLVVAEAYGFWSVHIAGSLLKAPSPHAEAKLRHLFTWAKVARSTSR